ncbi:hypothetical protein C942_00553 [Photobacterium marinum]|uniref:Uncharacterized protein n=1 Tax=Photobacterium marinum TaxID=1056511 RepID=L8JES5_9GAMM|nr:hypothetical protein C942_00553 [Photobacterium marinum]
MALVFLDIVCASCLVRFFTRALSFVIFALDCNLKGDIGYFVWCLELHKLNN